MGEAGRGRPALALLVLVPLTLFALGWAAQPSPGVPGLPLGHPAATIPSKGTAPPSALLPASALAGATADPSPVLGTYDPSALMVPTGGSHAFYPEAFLWTGTGAALASGALLLWNVSPSTLGTMSPSGTFTAGADPGNGTVTLFATLNGTSATNQVPVVVYSPVCMLLSLDVPSRIIAEPGTNLTLSARLLDRTGATCPYAPPANWTLRPSGFGTLSVLGPESVQVHVQASAAGDAWLTAQVRAGGALRSATLQISAVPRDAGVALQLSPQSARVRAGDVLPLVASVADGWGATPAGSFAWNVFPSTLGTLSSTSTASVSLSAGPAAGAGWVNVTFDSPTWGLLSSSVPVRVDPSGGPATTVGVYAPYLTVPPLLSGQGVVLSLEGTDVHGALSGAALNVTWQVHPASLGRLSGQGASVVFVAGSMVQNGSVSATANRSGLPPLSIPFPISVVAPALTSVAIYGGPSDHVPVGGSTFLEGVDQDLFGNLLLAGGYYGLRYEDMNTSWTLSPASLGTLTPLGNGTSRDLPEQAMFTAGGVPENGTAIETLRWAGETRTVSFPLVVVPRHVAAIALLTPATATPYGGVLEGAPVPLGALVLDQDGYPVGNQGNFSWQLAPGSDGSFAGSSARASVTVDMGLTPGVVLGNVSWTDGAHRALAEFLLDVVAPFTNASMIGLTEGGPSANVEAVDGSYVASTWQMGIDTESVGSFLTVGTTYVPGATGSVSWTLAPSSLGNLSNPLGREVNVSLADAPREGWLNASIPGPDGTVLEASVPIFVYRPHLAFVQGLTGPCLGACSWGLATFAGNSAYVGLAPYDQLGRPFAGVNWSGSVAPAALAMVSGSAWSLAAGSELVHVETNATAANGTVLLAASAPGGANATFELPLVVVPTTSLRPPGPPTGLSANASGQVLTLAWTPPADAGTGRVVNYTVEVAPGNGSASWNVSTSSPTLTLVVSASPERTYHVRVQAWNLFDLGGPFSPWVSVTLWRALAPSPSVVGTPFALDYEVSLVLVPLTLLVAGWGAVATGRPKGVRATAPRSTSAPPDEARPRG